MRRSKKPSFDHLVGELLEIQGHIEAQRLSGLEVDDELEFRRLLYRKVRWSFAFENAVYVGGSTFEWIDAINPISDQTAVLDERELASLKLADGRDDLV